MKGVAFLLIRVLCLGLVGSAASKLAVAPEPATFAQQLTK
jgi:hypothetical protein